jgi:hypothetical protein
MESLEAKLNKLKTAWDQFTMNIANNTLIKAGIDLLTGILNVINKITGVLPGVVGGFANLALIFGALRLGGALLTKALSGISAAVIGEVKETGVLATGAAAEEGTKIGATLSAALASGANNPMA